VESTLLKGRRLVEEGSGEVPRINQVRVSNLRVTLPSLRESLQRDFAWGLRQVREVCEECDVHTLMWDVDGRGRAHLMRRGP
jgi:hypothetical protein